MTEVQGTHPCGVGSMQDGEGLLCAVVPDVNHCCLAYLPRRHNMGKCGAGAECQANDVIIVLQIETLLFGEWIKDDSGTCCVPDEGAICGEQQVLMCVKATITKDVFQSEVLKRGGEQY